jgi:hypothetical protein
VEEADPKDDKEWSLSCSPAEEEEDGEEQQDMPVPASLLGAAVKEVAVTSDGLSWPLFLDADLMGWWVVLL